MAGRVNGPNNRWANSLREVKRLAQGQSTNPGFCHPGTIMVGRNVGYQEEERRCGPGAASLEEEAFEGLGRRGGDQGAEGRRLGQSIL